MANEIIFPIETLKDEFKRVRERYFNDIGVTCKIVPYTIVPHVRIVTAFFPHSGWQRVNHFGGTVKHEIGHPTIAPGSLEQHYRYYGIAAKVFHANSKSKEHYELLHGMLNVVYDMMVNRWIQKNADVDVQQWIEDTLHDVDRSRMEKNDVQWKVLIAFSQEQCGGALLNGIAFSDEISNAGVKSLAAVDRCFDKNKVTEDDKAICVKELCEIIRDVLEEEIGDPDESDGDEIGEENLDGESDDMKRLKADSGKGDSKGNGEGEGNNGKGSGTGGSHSEKDFGQESDDPIGTAKGKGHINGDQEGMLRSDDEYYQGHGDGVYKDSIENYRREARKALVMEGLRSETVLSRGLRAQKGTAVRGGMWLEGMKEKECDYVATLETHGMVLPDENVVRVRPKTKGVQENVSLDTHLIADTSASMSKREICVAMFSFLEYAAKLDGKMSTTLFAGSAYHNDSGKNASKLEKGLYEKWCSGGTDLVSGIKETEKAINKMTANRAKKQLVVMMSDFDDCERSQSTCKKMLESCASKGATVVVVEMGQHAKPMNAKGVLRVQSPRLENLAPNLLKASRKFIR